MNKLVLATMIMGAIGGSTFANGVVTGPVEPNTQAPVVSGYNSVAVGATLANKMINAGVSFRLGKGSEYETNHKGKIKQLENLVNQLVAEVEELKAGK